MRNRFAGVVSYVLIVVGALLASFSVACILLPNGAIDYGTAGIAIIISKLTGMNLSVCVGLLFVPFIAAGIICLGMHFSIKAIVGSVVYTVGLAVFEKVPFVLDTEHFLVVAFGGAILGAGLSLILRNGGCIDGSEILASIILSEVSKRTGRSYSMGPILISFNIVVYAVTFFVIDRTAALMSLLVYVVATVVIDKYTNHYEGIKEVTIITKEPDTIVKAIKEDMGKTCTIISSQGAIAGENKTLICYVNYFELQKIRDIISGSPGAFSTVSTVDEIIKFAG